MVRLSSFEKLMTYFPFRHTVPAGQADRRVATCNTALARNVSGEKKLMRKSGRRVAFSVIRLSRNRIEMWFLVADNVWIYFLKIRIFQTHNNINSTFFLTHFIFFKKNHASNLYENKTIQMTCTNRMRAMFLYFTMRKIFPDPTPSHRKRDRDPHLIQCALGSQKSPSKQDRDPFSRFCASQPRDR